MGVCGEKALYEVIFVGCDGYLALAATLLLLISLAWHTFYVASVSYGNYHIFIWYQVLNVYVIVIILDLSYAWDIEFVFNLF